MRVLIAGGGIGGIAAGIALRKEGHEPIVLEQAPQLGFVGQGINLGANAIKALRYLGAAEAVEERSVATSGWAYHGLADGVLQLEVPIGERYGGERYQSTHRADLLDALVGQLPPDVFRLGSRVTRIEELPDGVRVELAGGEEVIGDLLVGADGVNSVVRSRLFGDDDSQFSNFVAWRSAVPNAAAPEVAKRQELRLWSGSARYFVMYPIREDLVNVSAYVPAESAAAESWTAGGDIDELRATFSGACPEVQLALESLTNPLLTGIYVRDPLPTWVTDRIALLGDAAHAMGPFSGSGAGAAMEDAVTLAICLRGVDTPEAAAAALQSYNRRRVPRMTRLQTDARARLTSLSDPDPATPAVRAGIWAGMMTLDPFSELEFRWLYDHDAAAAAEQPLAAVGLDDSNPRQRPEAQRAYDLWRGALSFHDHAQAWRGWRAGYERFLMQECPAPADAVVVEDVIGGVPVRRVSMAGSTGDRCVMHLHGGGFMMGSARSAVELGGRIGQALSCQVVVPDYRLAPEYPHPVPIEDVIAVYRGLRDEPGFGDILITAEDAGGALALHVAIWARDNAERSPSAMFLASPFCDLTVSSDSLTAAGREEPWMDRQFATNLAASYIQSADPRSPSVSPVFADLHELPPLFLAVASDEALADDARALEQAARHAGVAVELMEVDDSVHSFVLFDFLPEAGEALRRFQRFAEAAAPQPDAGRGADD